MTVNLLQGSCKSYSLCTASPPDERWLQAEMCSGIINTNYVQVLSFINYINPK
jgi:hypothetical protein